MIPRKKLHRCIEMGYGFEDALVICGLENTAEFRACYLAYADNYRRAKSFGAARRSDRQDAPLGESGERSGGDQ